MLGFKSVNVGRSFDPNNPQVHVFMLERDSAPKHLEPFMCKLDTLAPVFDCHLSLWNDPKQYPQDLQDLQFAFGEHVELHFFVLLQHTVTNSDISARRFPPGRVIAVSVINPSPSLEFADKATAFFSGKIGAAPVIRNDYASPGEVYSKACVASMRKIQAKAMSELSINDRNEQKRCDGEAQVAILSGRLVSGRTTEKQWVSSDNTTVVSVTSSQRKFAIGGGAYLPMDSEVKVLVELNNKDAMEAWAAEAKKVGEDWKGRQKENAKSDF
jgi:hypothetical protein